MDVKLGMSALKHWVCMDSLPVPTWRADLALTAEQICDPAFRLCAASLAAGRHLWAVPCMLRSPGSDVASVKWFRHPFGRSSSLQKRRRVNVRCSGFFYAAGLLGLISMHIPPFLLREIAMTTVENGPLACTNRSDPP